MKIEILNQIKEEFELFMKFNKLKRGHDCIAWNEFLNNPKVKLTALEELEKK